jgi:DNA-binding transcriptional ArsR family regulator
MVDSERPKVWTVPRLQDAITATFFARAVDAGESESAVPLRYKDLKKGLVTTEGPVADRTLSRALSQLVEKGQLRREPQGREVYYHLTISRTERVTAFAKTEADTIRNAARIGGIGDLTEGWAFYGVPDILKDRVKKQLRTAAKRHRVAIEDIIDRTIDQTIHGLTGMARGRLSHKSLMAVGEALHKIFTPTVTGLLVAVRGQMVWSNIEAMIPGALQATRQVFGVSLGAHGGSPLDSAIDVWAKMLRVSPEEIREPIVKEIARLQKYKPTLEQFSNVLSAEENNKVGQAFAGLLMLTANLTSVVRP